MKQACRHSMDECATCRKLRAIDNRHAMIAQSITAEEIRRSKRDDGQALSLDRKRRSVFGIDTERA